MSDRHVARCNSLSALALIAMAMSALACRGSAPAGEPAQLRPQILTESLPPNQARLRPRILTESLPPDQARLRPRVLTETLAPPSPSRDGLRRLADSLLAAPMWRSAQWGVLIVDPASSDTLYSVNAGKLFVPASNTKLITGAVALAQLGPTYRYTTRLLGRAPQRDGTMRGDLVVIGRGDPSVSDSLARDAMAPLRALADSLAQRGVKRISGRLISGGDAFNDATLGYGWAWDNLDEEYAAPIDELLFNEGFARVIVIGGAQPGDPVRVRTEPATTVPRIGVVTAITGRNCCMERSRVTITGDVRGARPSVAVGGVVRAGDSVTVTVSLRHPNAAYLDAFAEALRARGITIAKGVEADSLADTTGMVPLASHTSPPMSAILAAFLNPSQNQIGEVLLKTLALERGGSGRADSGLVIVREQLAAWGVDSSLASLRDGSGLSRHNFIAPEAIVRVLAVMQQRADFDVFYQALSVGGVDGTLATRLRGTPAMANVHAKTGTLDKVRALSGYVTSADGRLLIFSMFANNQTVPTREVDRVQEAILAYLASMDAAPR